MAPDSSAVVADLAPVRVWDPYVRAFQDREVTRILDEVSTGWPS